MKIKKFEAQWCSTCKQIQPWLDSLGVEVESIDVEQDTTAAKVWGVRGLPTLVVFRDGHDSVVVSGGAEHIKREVGKLMEGK